MKMLNDSNTNWLGNIPAEWSIGRIGQLYSERRVKVSDTEYMPLSVTMKGVVPQLSTAAKTYAHDDRKLVRKGDFAINSRSDRRGSCGISEYDGSVSLINTILAPRKSMSPRYYNWLFHTSEFAAEFYKWGHGIVDDLWTTNWNDMKRILVPVPSLLEQERIANFLDRKCADIDNILEKTKASIEEYKKLKQSVITEAVTKGIRGKRTMIESGLEWIGLIPNSWHCRKIGNLFKYIGGYAFDSNTFQSEGSKQVLRIGNIKDDIIIESSNDVFIPAGVADTAVKCRVKVGQILFTMTGTKGKGDYFYTVCVHEEDVALRERYINQRVGAFEAKTDLIPEYFNYILKLTRVRQRVFLNETGTANQGNIGVEDLYRIAIPVPPIDEQQEIAEYLAKKSSEIDSLIASKDALIKNLESYRKSLIYEYVTGKKEVTA